jgi:hypothetical protein
MGEALMNIFLVPAPPENVEQTLSKKVEFEFAAQYLDNETTSRLAAALGGRRPFHCWATTDGPNRKKFEMMCPGDELLFAVTGTWRFEWRGQVKTKIVNDKLGRKLWPHAGNTGNQRSRGEKPWELIYIVDNLEEIQLDKHIVLQAFGYGNPQDNLGSLRHVPHDRTSELIARFHTMDGILGALSDQTPHSERAISNVRLRTGTSTKLPRKPEAAVTPQEALRSIIASGKYRFPSYKETPTLIAKVQGLFDGGGITLHEAAALVLAPFAKTTI